jgi:aspartate oxidase
LCFADTLTAGDHTNDVDLVDTLVHDSVESVRWLTELGVNLDDVNLCGGHTVARTHW